MGDLHFWNWVRLVVFVFLTSVTLDPTILNHGCTDKIKNAVRRLDSRKGIWFMGIFRWQHWQTGRFFNWGKPAGLPYQTSVTLDPIIQKPVDPIIQCTC